MRSRAFWPCVFWVACAACSGTCRAPKPTPFEDPTSNDAAPSSGEIPARCAVLSKIALDAPTEVGRATKDGARVLIGARRGDRALVLTLSDGAVTSTDLGPAFGDAPPPLPVIAGRTLAVRYEGTAQDHRLVLRDLAAPDAPLAQAPPEAADESLAYDAAATPDGAVALVWDAPSEDGSAIFMATARQSVVGGPVRVSPAGIDADSPRVLIAGGARLVFWIAHKSLPKGDAAPGLEGPAQDLERQWVETIAVDDTGKALSPLRHGTPDYARVTAFDVAIDEAGNATLLARDATELQAGQGGSLLLVRFAAWQPQPPRVVAEHVGHGAPLAQLGGLLLYDDPSERGRATSLVQAPLGAPPDGAAVSFEPALDAARPLTLLPPGVWLVAAERAPELRTVACSR